MYALVKKEENNANYDLFLKDIKDENNFSKKLEVLFDIQFQELFSVILSMPRVDFTKKLKSNISYILAEEYDPKIVQNNNYITILYKCSQKYNKKYNELIIPLIEEFEKHEKNMQLKAADADYIKNFRKHCHKTGEYAIHKCHKDDNEIGKFIPVYINKKIKYVICELCRKVYAINRFKNYCEGCKQIYYCNLLSPDEQPNLLPATWNPPHCENIINKNMYCNKCKNLFYLNLTTNQLQCINKSCKNIVDPSRIQWNCPTCNDLFRSGAKVFNPSEVDHCKFLIRKALIIKQKAHPYRIPCCKDLIDFKTTEFYHGKNCSGILYFVESDEKLIVVCQKCRAINWFSNFIWTCPKCKTRFRDVNSDRNEEILKKSKPFEIQNLNKENNYYEEKTFRKKTRLINVENNNRDKNLYSMRTLASRKNNYAQHYNTENEIINPIQTNGIEVNRNQGKNYIKINTNNKDVNNEGTALNFRSRGKYIFDRTIGKQLKSQKSECLTLRIKQEPFEDKKEPFWRNKKDNKLFNSNEFMYKNKYEEMRKKRLESKNASKNTESTDNNTNTNNNDKDDKDNYNNNTKENNNNNSKRRFLILKNHLRSKQKIYQDSVPQKPDDVTSASVMNEKEVMPIENILFKKNSFLFENIQRRLKKILSKGKLPVFNIDNYTIGKQIGDGSFGTIFEATNNKTKIKYALKKIVTSDINNLEKYQKEFEIVHQSTHPFILDIHGICFRCYDSTTFMIYVLMDLAEHDWEVEIFTRKTQNNNYYTESQLIAILKQLTDALLFLQRDKQISHRDIKPENILVFKNGIYKLSDFGEAEKGATIEDRQKTLRGTELYMSPLLHEGLLHDADYIVHNTFKSDVFSLGCCLVIAACLDFEVIKEIRKLKKSYSIKNYLIKIFKNKSSDKFIDLSLKMINFKENERVDSIELDLIIKKSFK
jgi:septum formation inhibitor MinC